MEGLGGCDQEVNCSHKFKISKESGRTKQNIQSSHKASGSNEALPSDRAVTRNRLFCMHVASYGACFE